MAKAMPRTISSNEAKQRWGSVVSAVSEQGERVVVESHGKPKVAIVPVRDLERLEELDQQERRDEALAWLRDFEKRQSERNIDLSDEEVEALVDKATHEAFDELAAEGKLIFERDRK